MGFASSFVTGFKKAGAPGGVGNLIVAVGNVAAAVITNPLTREGYYQANHIKSNVVPGIGEIFTAYYSGQITSDQLYHLCGWNGVQIAPTESSSQDQLAVTHAWRTILAIGRPAISIDDARDYWWQGRLTDAQYEARLKKEGLGDLSRQLLLADTPVIDVSIAADWWAKGLYDEVEYKYAWRRASLPPLDFDAFAVHDTPVPPVEWAIHQNYVGNITDAQLETILDRNGLARSEWNEQTIAMAPPLPPSLAMAYLWRGLMQPQEVVNHLSATILRDTLDPVAYAKAVAPIPTPAQAVGLMRSGAYDVDIVGRWQLDGEYTTLVGQLSHLSGWDYAQPVYLPDGTSFPGVDYPTLFWREHWSLMGMGDALAAWHRFGPRYVQRWQGVAPGIVPFTNDHLLDCMKKAAVPPAARQWALALSFAELPMGTIQTLYTYGKRDRQWAIDALGIHRYSANDAAVIVEGWDAQLAEGRFAPQRAAASKAITESIKRTVEAFSDGFISDTEAIMALVADGLQQPTAELLVQNATLAARHKQVASVVKRIEADWKEGALSDQQAAANLLLSGVQQTRIEAYITQWTAERNLSARVATSNQVIRWAAEGLLTPAQAQLRLTNLGWQAPDVALQLAEIQGRLIRAQAASAAARAKAARAQVLALARAQQQARAVISRAESAARRALPLGTLRSWFLRGIVTERYARHKLAVSGYSPGDINDYIQAWKLERSDYVAPGVAGTLAEKIKLPTVAEIHGWVKAKIIDAAEAEAELQGLGLSHDDVQHFLREWGLSAPIP